MKTGLFLLIASLFFLAAPETKAATNVSGNLTGNVTWTPAGSPYVVSAAIIPAGSSLTIEPGTVVKMTWSGVFVVSGNLTVGKSGSAQTVITAYTDDSFLGDSNNDGSATKPNAQYWGSINIKSGAQASFENTIVRYGGINPNGLVVVDGGTAKISGSELSNAYRSVVLKNGSLDIMSTNLHDNIDGAIYQSGGFIRFGSDTFTKNKTAISLSGGTFQDDGNNSGERGISISGTISGNVTLPKDGLSYIFSGVSVPSGASLEIKPGAVVKTAKGMTSLNSSGTLKIGEGDGEKAIFTSIFDDSVGGDTDGDAGATKPKAGDWVGIGINGGTASISNAEFKYGNGETFGEFANQGGDVTIDHSLFSDTAGAYQITTWSGSLKITNSEFMNGRSGIQVRGGTAEIHKSILRDLWEYGLVNSSSTQVNAENNWWGDDSGPWHIDHTDGKGVKIIGNVDFDPWTNCHGDTCHSNVMFLPGIEASRLYTDNEVSCNGVNDDNKKLWEPGCNGDVGKLYLDGDGKSIDTTIHAKEGDIIGEINYSGLNIYASFIDKMNQLRDADKSIRDWKAVAYDWRLSYDDILSDDSIINTLRSLAQNSNTQKVTIVAHSNGGLLAKALMRKIGDEEAKKLIDKVIFVAVPQVGTPMDVAAMLHGYKQDRLGGLVVSESSARGMAENMPGAYQLLPSDGYFSSVSTPVATFDTADSSDWKERYGDPIDSKSELQSFLSDTYRRVSATSKYTDIPSILNGELLEKAESVHGSLDNWEAPGGIKVIQIAGWGIDTVSNTQYGVKNKKICDGSICSISNFLVPYDHGFTIDGDGTVVSPSALWMKNVDRYWVNIRNYNKEHWIGTLNGILGVDHSNILEIPEFISFVSNSIINKTESLSDYKYMTSEAPSDKNKRLQYSLHSPLTLDLYDDQGRHTGVRSDGSIENQIPGTYYRQLGDIKYIFADEGMNTRIVMNGYDSGTFTFTAEEFEDDNSLGKITFKDLPTTPQTKVSFDVSSDIQSASNLAIDENGDGSTDYDLKPKIGEIVTLDSIPPTTDISLSGTQGTNDWFTGDVIATLSSKDNDGGTGVDKTEYSLDEGKNWIEYSEPFTIDQEGKTEISYFSTDKNGNKEEMKTKEIKIDKTAPEAKVSFNKDTKKLDISGSDNLSDVSVAIMEKQDISSKNKKMKKMKDWFSRWNERHRNNLPDMLATVTDEAGHVTSLSFQKTKDHSGFVFVRLKSIGYDGDETELSSTVAQYKWKVDRKGRYQFFASSLVSGSDRLESHYMSRKDETWIMEKSQDLPDDDNDGGYDSRPVRKKVSGMAVPYFETDKSEIKINY